MTDSVSNKGRELLSDLFSKLDSDDPQITVNTLIQLSCLEKTASSALPKIIELCHSMDDRIRSAAAAAVSRINDLPEKSIPILTSLLDDESITVQRYAAAGLCLFEHSDLVEQGVMKKLERAYDQNEDTQFRSFIGSILARRAEPKVSLST